MYEAVVLQKKKPKNISKTPFAKLNLLYKFTMVLIPTSFVCILFTYINRKKELLKELDEFNINDEKVSLVDEYYLMQNYWKHWYLRGITAEVLSRYREEGRLLSTDESTNTVKDVLEGIKDTPVI